MRFECSGSGLYRRYWVALSPGGEAAGQGRSVEPDRAKMSRRTVKQAVPVEAEALEEVETR